MIFGAASLPLYLTLSGRICETSVERLLEDSVWTSGYSPCVPYREPEFQRLCNILSFADRASLGGHMLQWCLLLRQECFPIDMCLCHYSITVRRHHDKDKAYT